MQSQAAQQVKEVFEQHCTEAGVPGTFTLGVGQVTRQICERARLADLVVLSLSHPYSPQPAARLGSGLRQILRRSPAPVVTVPKHVAGLDRVLLAYDGSPKAAEALFVGTYLAGRWDVPLVVLAVMDDPGDTLLSAQSYAEDHGVQVIPVGERGPVAEMILVVAEEQNVDLVVMGGYRAAPVVEFALGSTVERVLRSSSWPVLVCQ
jgi:nucleotide-binding universal stress UspA family protein